MKFAQKWVVVPFNHYNKTSNPCPPSKEDEIQKDLTKILKKETDLHTKVNEYNQVIAKHQEPTHPIVPHQSSIQELKTTPARKSLDFVEETPYLNDVTIFDTPTGHDPYTGKIKKTGRKNVSKSKGKVVNLKSANKARQRESRLNLQQSNRSLIQDIEESPDLKSAKKARQLERRLNLERTNRSLIRDIDESPRVQEGNGLITKWKILH